MDVGRCLESKTILRTPKAKFTFSPTYDLHVGGGTVRVQADHAYIAHTFNVGRNTVLPPGKAANTINAAIHYIPPSKLYGFIFGGSKLGDDRWLTVGTVNDAAGAISGSYNLPQMWYFHDHGQDAVTRRGCPGLNGPVREISELLNPDLNPRVGSLQETTGC